MIKTEKGITEIEGGLVEIMADTALVLTNLYVMAKDEVGEASAKEMIVKVGRVAMADETIAGIKNKKTALESGMKVVEMECRRRGNYEYYRNGNRCNSADLDDAGYGIHDDAEQKSE